MMDPDWEDLRHFAALARALNLARAASELRTSQATVQRRVRALEANLATPLFVRRRDGHRLTRAGEELAQAIAPISDHVRDGIGGIMARQALGAPRARIVTTELVANWILVPALGRLIGVASSVRVDIEASAAPRGLLDDAETLAIRFLRPERGPYVIRKLRSVEFAIYTRVGSAAAGLIGWCGENPPASLSRWIQDLASPAIPIFALNTMSSHLEAARQGLGMAGLPTFLGDRDPLLERSISSPQIALDAWLVVPIPFAATALAKQVMRWIVGAFGAAYETPAD